MSNQVVLRDVTESDLPIFFEHQRDPDANRMVAFTSRDPEDETAFTTHWKKILGDGGVTKKTILFNGRVVGNVLMFELSGQPSVGYWIGKEYWGRGVATRALAEFLRCVATRPLYARVAKDNLGSIRVLEKCGFKTCGQDQGFSLTRGEEVEEWILKLDGNAAPRPNLDGLRTPRLVLARMQASDLDDLARMDADPRVMATLGGVRSEEQTASYLEKQIAHWEQYGFGYWTLRDPATGQFIGRGGLRHALVEGQPEVEVGYALMAEYWGRGLGAELARESVRVGFAELRLSDLVAFTLPTNHASRRVMEKAGFRYERDIIHADLPHVLYRQTAR